MFGDGSFKREGMAAVIQWMVDNRNNSYFKNLEYLQISGHKAASFEGTGEDAALQRDVQAGSREADLVVRLVVRKGICRDE